MKKLLIILFVLSCFVLTENLSAQVVADFENAAQGTQGFWYGWGNAGSNFKRVEDPTHGGVLSIDVNVASTTGDGPKAAIGGPDPMPFGWTETKVGARFFTVDVFVPADFPDKAEVKLWSQDKVNWSWLDVKYVATPWDGVYQLVKGAWNTLTFPIARMHQLNPKYVPWNAKGGIELFFPEAGWVGTVLIDNFALVGVEPKLIADFATGTQGFWYGWGNAGSNLRQMDGALAIDLNVTSTEGDGPKAAIGGPDPLPLGWTETEVGAYAITYKVFVPADFPDSAQVKLWCQDKVNWTWNDVKYSVAAPLDGSWKLVKGEWNFLAFPVYRTHQINPNFVPWNAKGGLEFWFNRAGWSGTVMIDDAAIHGLEVGKKWVFADFEKQALGTQGFANTGWNKALTAVAWAADPSGRTAGVLQTDWNSALDAKSQIQLPDLDVQWTESDTGATAVTFDIWVPENTPKGTQVGFWAMDKKNWTWTENYYQVTDSTLIPGKWNTIMYDIVKFVKEGKVNPVGTTLQIGVQILFFDLAWSGSIYFDNFTLIGLEKPAGSLKSPAATVSVETDTTAADVIYDNAVVEWTDNEENLNETYTVYASLQPITDVNADGVLRIGTKIPRAVQYWNHRPYTTNGDEVTYYYAVTATGLDGNETPLENGVGPVTLKSSKTMKAIYKKDFDFNIDGSLAEFEVYKEYANTPEGGNATTTWDSESTDINGTIYFVTDDYYLYIGAEVVDDDVVMDPGGQAWEGDALEFFMSIYPIAGVKQWHDLGDIDKAGMNDYRFAFTSWGEIQKNGTAVWATNGMEFLVLPSPTGYLIEALIEFDSLAVGGYMPKHGDMLPCRVDINDKDLVADAPSTTRVGQCNLGGAGNTEGWKRPSTWGYLEIYDLEKVGVEKPVVMVPLKTEISANYPNPFNPTTSLRYDIAKDTQVSLVIYNMLGQKIKTLVDAPKAAGSYQINWDGTNDAGQKVTTGIYFYTFKADGFQKTNKMLLVK
ncbi:T9SS type A sorting domain-containing protein [candidate division KSB1 bacterium]|nr:T9SS type A sorting domain-containing protein [candidate division KSB1 bacterium]